MRKLADGCEFETITPEEILRDRLVFGIRDAKVRERLLRKTTLTLAKTDEICHAAESMMAQMKVVEDGYGTTVNAVKTEQKHLQKPQEGVSDGKRTRECWNCGRRHEFHKRELYPAYGKTCIKCRKPNHFAAKCRGRVPPKTVKSVDDTDEIFQTQASRGPLDDSQLVTLKLDTGNYLRFQVDTGAQCNVVSVGLYKKATRDVCLANVTPCRSHTIAHGGTTIPVVGTVLLRVQLGNLRCRLYCKLVHRTGLRPLLGRKACLGMQIVSYLDNDQLHKPNTGDATVYTLEMAAPLSPEQLCKKYPMVFSGGVGLLEDVYHIRLDPAVEPVQHSPRRIPVPLRNSLQDTLDDLVNKISLHMSQNQHPGSV